MDDEPYSLRLRGVTKRYGDHLAVDSLSFEVKTGVIYGVLGPNGAGKSTTLRMINDIAAPDEGDISLLEGLSPGREAARRIGYLPEERGLYPKMRVGETLTFFAELRGIGTRDAMRRAGDWLTKLGLDDWARNKVQDLSKGMQQKVQFASALIHEPELVILDEPWSGLDPINAEVLREIVLEQRALGRTVLFSTHLMEQAEKICDYVCIIARGRKVVEGALAEVKREAAGERLLAVAFETEAEATRARQTVLDDPRLVAVLRARNGYDELELATEVRPQAVLEELVRQGLVVRRFERVEPSLHQIFVDRVGSDKARHAVKSAR